ncbi:MAG: efflux RND transporter periplasmic adaptor subunit [Flavobacterium sp.]|nr:MAG: efflux RND transporter periplasmic adaptor subunit [Flavobacterium sp.]
MKKKTIIIVIVLALVGLIVFKLSSNKSKLNEKNAPAKNTEVRMPVTAATVQQETQEINMVKTGALAPFKEAKVLSVSGGTVEKLLFSLGDQVKQGQVLAVIETRLVQLDLQKSESNVAKLRQDLQTYTELLEGNAATREKVNEIRQNYKDALNQSQQLRRQVSDASVKAPTSGIIGSKPVEEGVFVTAGTEIATVVNLSQVKVRVNLTETEVYQVKQGQKVKLTTDIYPGKTFEGAISFISPQADQTHNYQVEITAGNDANAQLRSGTFVYADFSRKTSQQIVTVPREALLEGTRDASVYVIQGDKVALKSIKTGPEYGDKVQVLTGLNPGDQVVVSGQINLKDGTLISVSK